MAKVPATEFKARCLQLMDRVAETRTTYVITKRGKAVARLVPVERAPGEPLFGRLRDMAEETGDIVGPIAAPGDWSSALDEEGIPAEGAGKRPARRSGQRGRTPK